jgi:metal-responsive CopG/Arc/MetJ family transcriptional regulator
MDMSEIRATTAKTSILIDIKLLNEIDRFAAIDGQSRSATIEKLIRKGIDMRTLMDSVHLFAQTLSVIDKRLKVIEANTVRDQNL